MKIGPIAMAARSKAYVCGRSIAGTAGSNPAGSMDVCCVLSGRVTLHIQDFEYFLNLLKSDRIPRTSFP
jgi:hypothetical protein